MPQPGVSRLRPDFSQPRPSTRRVTSHGSREPDPHPVRQIADGAAAGITVKPLSVLMPGEEDEAMARRAVVAGIGPGSRFALPRTASRLPGHGGRVTRHVRPGP